MSSRKNNQFNSLASGRNLSGVPKSMKERYKYLLQENKYTEDGAFEGVKGRLSQTRELIPGESEIIYNFCNYLSGYINDTLLPEGFLLGCNLALYDIGEGKNGFTGEEITDAISKTNIDEVNSQVRDKIPELAKKLFGKEFGEKVESLHNNVMRKVKIEQEKKQELTDMLGVLNKTNTGEGFEYKDLEEGEKIELNEQEVGDRIYEIREKIEQFMKKISNNSSIQDHFNDGVNPYYNQTEQGFFLEYYYGSPNKLWTPWGQIGIPCIVGGWGGTITPELEQEFLEIFDAEIFMEKTTTQGAMGGVVGPVYALKKIGSKKLPTPKKRNRKEFLSYEECDNTWDRVSKSHK